MPSGKLASTSSGSRFRVETRFLGFGLGSAADKTHLCCVDLLSDRIHGFVQEMPSERIRPNAISCNTLLSFSWGWAGLGIDQDQDVKGSMQLRSIAACARWLDASKCSVLNLKPWFATL